MTMRRSNPQHALLESRNPSALACSGLPESSDSTLPWLRWLGRIPIIDYVAVSNWGIILNRLLKVTKDRTTPPSISDARRARRLAAEIELQRVEAQWAYACRELDRIGQLVHDRIVGAEEWHHAHIRKHRLGARIKELDRILSPSS